MTRKARQTCFTQSGQEWVSSNTKECGGVGHVENTKRLIEEKESWQQRGGKELSATSRGMTRERMRSWLCVRDPTWNQSGG